MRTKILSDRGQGPALVFLPGMDGTGELLLGTAAKLEEHFRVLCMRYVDEGREGSAETYERLADTASDALTAAGVQHVILLAESFGGGVALQLALRHPARVQALALVNTFAWYPRRIRLRLGAACLPFVPQAFLRLGRRLFGNHIFFRPRRDPGAERGFAEVAPGLAGEGFAARMNAIRHLDLRDRLGEISAACLLLVSTHDRVVPSRATMFVLAQRLPNATLEVVDRANHLILPLEDEPWCERLVDLERASRAAVHPAG